MTPVTQPIDQASRDAVAHDLDTTFFVEAAAGTGKTKSLVSRIVAFVTSGKAKLNEIIAITFTEKAAGELKMRVREAIEQETANTNFPNILRDLESAHITTIHSFCASLLREWPVEAAVDPQFEVADEIQTSVLLEEAWNQWIQSELEKQPQPLLQAIAFDVKLSRLFELAKILVNDRNRLKHATWPAKQPFDVESTILSLNKQAAILEDCLSHTVQTDENAFHQAKLFINILPNLKDLSTDRKIALLAAVDLKQPGKKTLFDSDVAFKKMKEAVDEIRPRLQQLLDHAEHNFFAELMPWLHRFVDYFQQIKSQHSVLDFDDLLLKTRDLLRDNDDVRTRLQNKFRAVLVDEFQDTDTVQTEIILSLGKGPRGKLFLVGDPKQSIYGFRRADIEVYENTKNYILENGKSLIFQQNFRSTSPLVEWVNDVFSRLIRKPNDGTYQPEYVPLAPLPAREGETCSVTLLMPSENDDEKNERRLRESTAIAQYISSQVEAGKFEWGEVVLLFRSFTAIDIYESAFLKINIPHRIIGGKGYYQRQEIQTLSSLLTCLDNPADQLSLIAVLRSVLFGWTDELIFQTYASSGLNYSKQSKHLADEQVEQSFALLRQLHNERHEFTVSGFIEHVFTRMKVFEAFAATSYDSVQCLANLSKALELARRFESAGIHSLRGFVDHLRQTIINGVDEEPSPASEETENVVRFMTMHKSKGLEFPLVVLADLGCKSKNSRDRIVKSSSTNSYEINFNKRKTLDFQQANDHQKNKDSAEEIRLLYVAATRAKERLVIPWFQDSGGCIDLLKKGFEPVASDLVEVVQVESTNDVRKTFINSVLSREKIDVAHRIMERRSWLIDRENLLRVASSSPRTSRPSTHEDYIKRDSPTLHPGRRAQSNAADIGTVVHEALEKAELRIGLDKQLVQTREILSQSKLNKQDTSIAMELIERGLRSALWARVCNAETVIREMPVLVAEQGQKEELVEGKIDLLFYDNGRWALVDYKTDRKVNEERYRHQLELYATALKRIAGVNVAEKLLFFLTADLVVESPNSCTD